MAFGVSVAMVYLILIFLRIPFGLFCLTIVSLCGDSGCMSRPSVRALPSINRIRFCLRFLRQMPDHRTLPRRWAKSGR